jgi:hypothetical protein
MLRADHTILGNHVLRCLKPRFFSTACDCAEEKNAANNCDRDANHYDVSCGHN